MTYFIVGLWLLCSLVDYLGFKANMLQHTRKWTHGDRAAALTLAIFGPVSLVISLFACFTGFVYRICNGQGDDPASW